MGLGLGTIRLRATAPASAGTGRHALVYLNTHVAASSVYLVNALLPSDARIQISAQQRDVEQRGVTLDYRVGPSEGWVRGGWLVTVVAMFGVLRRRRGGRLQAAQLTFTLRATDVPDEKSRNGILGRLAAYNESQTSRSDYRPLIIAIDDAQGRVVGGLWACTEDHWLCVDLLFVHRHTPRTRAGL